MLPVPTGGIRFLGGCLNAWVVRWSSRRFNWNGKVRSQSVEKKSGGDFGPEEADINSHSYQPPCPAFHPDENFGTLIVHEKQFDDGPIFVGLEVGIRNPRQAHFAGGLAGRFHRLAEVGHLRAIELPKLVNVLARRHRGSSRTGDCSQGG